MPISNKERQKRWRERNGARYNLERRNARKGIVKDSGVPVERFESVSGSTPDTPPSTPKSKIEELRELVKCEQERVLEAPVALPAKFGTYRDDGGRPITERAWNELQKKKEHAEKGGYVYDEFSQA